jgi:hypothetical protein
MWLQNPSCSFRCPPLRGAWRNFGLTIQCALEENTAELESFARQHFDRSDLFVDPIWMPSPGKFTLAIFSLEDAPDLYRALTLEPHFSQGAIHLRVTNTVEKHVPLPWEDCA